MSLPGMVFETLFEFTVHQMEQESNLYHSNPKAFDGLRVKDPKWANPHGPHYRMHPELSRPIAGIVTSTFAAPVAFIATPIALATMNYAIIEHDVPEEQRSGYWQMFSSALTGTFGGDYSGLI